MDKTKVIRIFEAFAGIGSQLEALKNIDNIEEKPLGYVEWFIPAIISYEIIHYGILKENLKTSKEDMAFFLQKYNFSSDSKKPVSKKYWDRMPKKKIRKIYPYLKRSIIQHNNLVDITKVKNLPNNIDILTYSFPCQDLSQQGKQNGIKKGTRSGLLWEIERILLNNKKKLPKYLLLENVMALVSKKFINNLELWIHALNKLGYSSEYKILNSQKFGSSQSRSRVFMISKLKNLKIKWPQEKVTSKKISSILGPFAGPFLNNLSTYERDNKRKTKAGIVKQQLIGYTTFNSENYIYYPNGYGPTLTASGANSRIKIVHKKGIRYMTPREAYKYMGFKGKSYDLIKETNLVTEQKSIFTCGNSISVEILQSIFEEMF